MAKLKTPGEWTREQKAAARAILLEADGGELIGRDPRKVPAGEFERAGIVPTMVGGGGLDVLRARCLDCCAEQEAEVRKCVAVACVNWPYRMNANPFRKQNISDEHRAALAERGRALAARRPRYAFQRRQDAGRKIGGRRGRYPSSLSGPDGKSAEGEMASPSPAKASPCARPSVEPVTCPAPGDQRGAAVRCTAEGRTRPASTTIAARHGGAKTAQMRRPGATSQKIGRKKQARPVGPAA